MELENTEILSTESRWFEKGVKEDICIKALNPSLNMERDEGEDKQAKEGGGGGWGLVSIITHIITMTTVRLETDEADRSQ